MVRQEKGVAGKPINRGADGDIRLRGEVWIRGRFARFVGSGRSPFLVSDTSLVEENLEFSSSTAGNLDCVSQTLAWQPGFLGPDGKTPFSLVRIPDHKHGFRLRSSKSGTGFCNPFAFAITVLVALIVCSSSPFTPQSARAKGCLQLKKRRV